MRPISPKHKKIIASDPYYRVCARKNEECAGRISIDHVFLYANKQIDELFNLLPVCSYHHGIEEYANCKGQDKTINQTLALQRATRQDIEKYPRLMWRWEKVHNE